MADKQHIDYDKELVHLLATVKAYNPKMNEVLIKKAFTFARTAHKDQKRESGEEFIEHPIAVAKLLIELKADSATLTAAFLHDVVEDTAVSLDLIKKEFGEEVATIVEGVTKIDKIHFNTKEEYTAENLRKIILATTKDIRIILLKLADRLHNMTTLKNFRPEKQKRIAQETKEIYVPLAHKLGIYKFKGELEDLCLRYLEPKVYQFLSARIAEKRTEREKKTDEIIRVIQKHLDEKNIKAEIYGRAKYFYSIYKKMKKKNIDFDQIYDLIAIRIVTRTIPDCYAALGVIHDLWRPIPKRFKDYISVPKANGYQSLHTTLVTNQGKILEVQIRTEKMHHLAEEGVAAHWRYQGTERDKLFDRRIEWLKQVLDWKIHSSDAKDFVETLKVDLFEDEIVVFTPKGDPISLPVGSTPIDFAYEVHSNIGNSCSKAKVNNSIVPLNHKLASGDIVEIVTQKNASPNRQWLSFVKTSKAKTKIRQTLGIVAQHDPTKGRKVEPKISPSQLLSKIIVNSGHHKHALKLSKCCSPLFGDEIVGYYMKDKTVTIHRKECPNIHALTKQKQVKVRWDKRKHYTALIIAVKDRVGLLADVLSILARKKINVIRVVTKRKKDHIINKLVIEECAPEDCTLLVREIKLVEGTISVHAETVEK